MENKLTLGVLITTMNNGIKRVKKELLPQLKDVDEVIISHQITDENISPEKENLGENIKYVFMREKGLSKNRNNALKYATADICYICDDDLDFIEGFEKIIKNSYADIEADIITFQAQTPDGKKHFPIKEGKHSKSSILRIWSWGITFKREVIQKNNIIFDEEFGLGARYPVGEENIFLTDCYKKGLKMFHCEKSIVIHKEESSGIDYKNREDLIIARIKLWKRVWGVFGGMLAIPYFTIFHYKYYKKYFSIWHFFSLSFKSLINEK
ncbi:glycosyltransferase [Candidatus Gracilibacteria bacterium]|nr:glycosyltransferase [Candidatus Gracilibacteria bacterium]